METVISSFLLIFFAEMGDKTQFLAFIFATRYKLYQVILGISLGIVFNHGLAVLVATFLSSFINIGILKIIAGVMFLLFGFESFILRIENDDKEDIRGKFGAIFTVALCFFIGELGDKTQITAMSIVFTGKNPILVLIGTTLGMIFVSLFGIIVGKIIKGKIPKNLMKKISGVCFITFGIEALSKSIPSQYLTFINTTAFYIICIITMLLIYFRNKSVKKSI